MGVYFGNLVKSEYQDVCDVLPSIEYCVMLAVNMTINRNEHLTMG